MQPPLSDAATVHTAANETNLARDMSTLPWMSLANVTLTGAGIGDSLDWLQLVALASSKGALSAEPAARLPFGVK